MFDRSAQVERQHASVGGPTGWGQIRMRLTRSAAVVAAAVSAAGTT